MQCFFILGREPELSIAEIKAKFSQLNIPVQPIALEDDFIILNTEGNIDVNLLMNQLAGTIKIGEIVKESASINPTDFALLIPKSDNKINFGISAYNTKTEVNKLGKALKQDLKREGRSARFVTSKVNPLSSVIVKNEHLLDKGVEIVILRVENKMYLGKTIAVQDFEKFSELDYGRPARDAKRGMLPPKLAQMMINISEAREDATILDPFCGIGTVLQQAAVLGFENIIGSDVDNAAVDATTENMRWLKDRNLINQLPANDSPRVFQCDIRDIAKNIPPHSIDVIITEPSLGPALRGREPEAAMKQIINDLTRLYRETFVQMRAILKPNATIVIALPTFKINERIYAIDFPRLLPPEMKIEKQWQYVRPEQHVMRNILKIKFASNL